jgi:hypothetical protein
VFVVCVVSVSVQSAFASAAARSVRSQLKPSRPKWP